MSDVDSNSISDSDIEELPPLVEIGRKSKDAPSYLPVERHSPRPRAVSLESENATTQLNSDAQTSTQSETAAPITTEAIKCGVIIESGLRRSKCTRRTYEDRQQDGNESDGTIDKNESENEDETDGEVEELVHGSHQIVGEGVVETKSWVEIRRQLDSLLKRETVKRQLPFSQVCLSPQ